MYTKHDHLSFQGNTYLLIIIFYISLLTMPLHSQSHEYYIHPAGSNLNSGTSPNSPWKTVQKAIDAIPTNHQGVLINIMGSENTRTEYDQWVVINKTGTDQYRIILKAYGMYTPVFAGSNPTTFNDSKAVFEISGFIDQFIEIDGITIKDVTAKNTLMGIWISGNRNVIKNCQLKNLKRSGIIVQGSYNIIDSNTVSDITGVIGQPDLRGNNISVESYYSQSIKSEFNVISNNYLNNNPTHFGVNIFPDPNIHVTQQPIMEGNKIFNNYISYTGGGIYTRYQKNMDIYNNIIVHSSYNAAWETQGGGIALEIRQQSNPHILPIDAGIIRIYNNTIADNEFYGFLNRTSNHVIFRNNIIVQNYNQNFGYFVSLLPLNTDNSTIDYNLYYGGACWKWEGQSICNFESWKSEINGDDNSVINLNPLFSNSSYTLEYTSPAKNQGVGLLSEGISNDKYSNPRPYWNKDFDIGAYEVEDTQLKIGAAGVGSLEEVIHSVTAFGNFWERNPDGTFYMSESYELQTATESSTGNFDEENLFAFPGMEYNWLDRSNNSSGKKIAAGFYRVTNDLDPTKFMYVDLRDEVDNYSLNVYLRYKYDLNPALSRFQYYDPSPAVKDFVDLNDYQYPVVTIWQINHFDLQNSPFWEDGVVVVKSPANHPLVCWLPFGTGNIYTVERSSNCVNPNNWAVVGSTTNEFLEDTGLEFCTAVPPATCFECTYNYRVKQSTSTTYPASVSLVGTGQVEKYAASNSDMGLIFSLEQNYPNPFNPVTNIRYSLPEDELLTLKIYDILGREVLTLVNERKTAGKYEVKFDGSSLSSGIYICQLSTEKYRTSKKIHLIK
jgi:parallel beta-helix repeat protein